MGREIPSETKWGEGKARLPDPLKPLPANWENTESIIIAEQL